MKLYQRHGAEVEKAFEFMQVVHAKALRRRTLPEDCLLRIIFDAASVTVLPMEGSPPTKRVGEGEVRHGTASLFGRVVNCYLAPRTLSNAVDA